MSRLRSHPAVRGAVRRAGVHRVVALAGLVQLPFLAVLSALVRRVPRDPRLVAVGAPMERFADNAAYVFAHLRDHPSPGLRAVWVSGSPEVVARLRAAGCPAVRRWTPRGALTALRAGTFVYSGYRSDVNRWLSAGARAVNLWHGLPIKQIEGGVAGRAALGRVGRWLDRAGSEPPPDLLLSTSPYITDVFARSFRLPADRCLELGYPRADHLLREPDRPPALLTWHPELLEALRSADRVVGLFLTWRDDRSEDVIDADLIRRIAQVCSERGATLVYKAHFNVAASVAPPGCVVLPSDADLSAYLGLCDVLITDYSSVALDFLLLRRPVVYYTPDLAHYRATRGFVMEPTALPGRTVEDEGALLDAVEHALGEPGAEHAGGGDEGVLRRVWGDHDGGACARVVRTLEDLAAREGAVRQRPRA